EGEDSRHDHDEPQREKSQLQHHPCDRAHLTNRRNLTGPTWFHPHFVANEIMQDGGTDQNDRVARNDENREPYWKFSIIRNALAIVNRQRYEHRNHQNPNDRNFVGGSHWRKSSASLGRARNLFLDRAQGGSDGAESQRRLPSSVCRT